VSDTDRYEERRRRHVDYAMARMPEYIARLGFTRAAIEAEQTGALRALVAHAVAHSPWHRARLGHIDAERLSAARLADLPTMTKDDLMAHWDDIVTVPGCTLRAAEAHLEALTSDAYFLDDLHVIASGGSSGTRGVFVYDWHGWAVCFLGLMRGVLACAERLGRPPSGPFASVSAYRASHATGSLPQTFSLPGHRTVAAPVTLPLPDIVAILNDAQPWLLQGYASMLPVLCDEARAGRLRIAPALVWSTSEPLLPELRADAEATFGVPVLNGWAASESNGGAFSCLAGDGFHIGEDLNVIEPVDTQGRPVPPGERSARILLTNLYNHAMPLIRYEITDEFEVADTPCACGSTYRKVNDVHGRADDVFAYDGGIRVHPLNFRGVLGQTPSVVEYQVVQTPRGARVDVVARRTIDADALRAALAERLARLGVKGPDVVVRVVPRIARQSTGKLKRFVPLSSPPA
jgi:phenylacetate-CoA ligase